MENFMQEGTKELKATAQGWFSKGARLVVKTIIILVILALALIFLAPAIVVVLLLAGALIRGAKRIFHSGV